jgi:RNA-directed DNA polymerase
LKKISLHVRRWRLHRWIYHTFSEVARTINPVVAGWMQYYGRFYPSALYRLLARINAYLVRWIRNKYRRYDKTRAARRKFAEVTSEYPRIFRHWRWVTSAW